MFIQIAWIAGCKVTLVAFVWFFSSIVCLSHWNIYIDHTFTEININCILIHDKVVLKVVPCEGSVANWEKSVLNKQGAESESEIQYNFSSRTFLDLVKAAFPDTQARFKNFPIHISQHPGFWHFRTPILFIIPGFPEYLIFPNTQIFHIFLFYPNTQIFPSIGNHEPYPCNM